MTSALVECAFISNPEEAALLASDDFQNKIAQGIVNGIHAYVNSAGIAGSAGSATVSTGQETLRGDVLINIDAPKNDETVSGVINLQGWAIDRSATVTTGVTAIHVYDGPANGPGNLVGIANYGVTRQDVAGNFGKANLASCGFNLQINTNTLTKGTHVLHVYAQNEAVGWKYTTVRINVVNDGSPLANSSSQTTTTTTTTATQTTTQSNSAASVSVSGTRKTVINIDAPKSGETVNGNFILSGWAVETSSVTSTGITAIHIYDGPANGESNFLGAATYGISRPDVASYYGKSNFQNSGFSANIGLSKLSNGKHNIYVYAYNQEIGWKFAVVSVNVGSGGGSVQTAGITQVSSTGNSGSGNTGSSSQSVTASGSKVIMINVDTPSNGSGVSGDFTISGWAVDKNSTSGTGINMVHVYDGPANGAQNMLGVAAYGLSRQDVASAFGNGNLLNSGFSITVSGSRLANGNHTIYIYANNPDLGWKYATVNINIGGSSATSTTSSGGSSVVTGGTNMVGYVPVSVDQLLKPFINRGSGQINRARRLAGLYIKWGQAFNIRADIAWAQMCHESGFLEFTGVAKADWNNFAGVGVTGPGAVVTFASEELGVVAHYAHLAWYVYPNHVNGYCSSNYDPRHSGSHKYNGDSSINCLNGRWAPAADYSNKIIAFANQIWQ
jgi:hypothetical protein